MVVATGDVLYIPPGYFHDFETVSAAVALILRLDLPKAAA